MLIGTRFGIFAGTGRVFSPELVWYFLRNWLWTLDEHPFLSMQAGRYEEW